MVIQGDSIKFSPLAQTLQLTNAERFTISIMLFWSHPQEESMKVTLTIIMVLLFTLQIVAAEENQLLKRVKFPESNYIITGFGPLKSSHGKSDSTSHNNQVKFKINLAYKVFGSDSSQTGVYLGYTQNSFWNFFDNSYPFNDNNYKPELTVVLETSKNKDTPFKPVLKVSLNHESNGVKGPRDRGWDRILGGIDFCHIQNGGVFGGLDLWATVHTNKNNSDIRMYAGDGVLKFGYFRLKNDLMLWGISNNTRVCFNNCKFTSNELDFYCNPFRNLSSSWRWMPSFMVQYFSGTGEYLLNYKVHSRSLRIGFTFL